MDEKLSERLHSAIKNEVGYGMAFEQLQPETQALLKGVDALEAERDEVINLLKVRGEAADREVARVIKEKQELESRLAEAKKLPELWRGKEAYPIGGIQRFKRLAYLDCAFELEAALRGEADRG